MPHMPETLKAEASKLAGGWHAKRGNPPIRMGSCSAALSSLDPAAAPIEKPPFHLSARYGYFSMPAYSSEMQFFPLSLNSQVLLSMKMAVLMTKMFHWLLICLGLIIQYCSVCKHAANIL